ncbi:MAG: tRNA (adenosine(37)-N6)-threonylcarbamoyltransferase complex transferase subunit TsaD, partial [Bacteroidales bacterium]
TALKQAGITKEQLNAIAFTRGPGLLGSLLVGVSFAKALGLGLHCPLIEINHLEAHILSHFIKANDLSEVPQFPFLCLLVSGGHTQIIQINSAFNFQIIGTTIDDAAGEAIDKSAKIMGLAYPGGPIIDRLAKEGNPLAFSFAEPKIGGLNYSFSGLKTSFLYFVRDRLKENPSFIEENIHDLCASIQYSIVHILLVLASKQTGIKQVAIAGGVSANSLLRQSILEGEKLYNWKTFIPPFSYTTDNAAMVGIAGFFKFKEKQFCDLTVTPYTRGANASF